MKINVTRNDIKKGKSSCNNCPIALSLKRKGFKNVEVTYSNIVADHQRIETPREVRRFLYDFDTGPRQVDPIEFDIPLKN